MALLLGSTAFLVGTGLVMVLSASSVSAFAEYGDSFVFVQRQAVYAIVGVLALVVASRMRIEAWRRLAVPFLLVTVAMLILVLHPAIGVSAYGSSRWFELGPVTVQPSEIAKLALVVFSAAILARRWGTLEDLGQLVMPLLPVSLLVCGLVIMQPDLGTTVILAGTMFLLLFAAGVRLRYLAFAGFVGIAGRSGSDHERELPSDPVPRVPQPVGGPAGHRVPAGAVAVRARRRAV